MKRNTKWAAVVMSAAVVALTAAPFFAQQIQSSKDEVALRAAMERETVRGDLKGAIEQYKEIAQSKDRSIAARSLVRMAGAYQKLGNAEAQMIFERVVKDYADQREAVSIASSYLDGVRPASSDVVRRRIWSGPDLQQVSRLGRVSPDGRYLSFTENAGNNLMVRDLSTGGNRLIARTTGRNVEFGWWSPDTKRLAFRGADQGGSEIRIINLDGTGVRTLLRSSDPGDLWVEGWSPDGKKVLGFSDFDRQASRFRLFWLDSTDGSTQTIATATRRGGSDTAAIWVSTAVTVSPDGRYVAFTGLTDTGAGIHLIASDGSGDTLLSADPVDRGSIGWSPDSKSLLVASTRMSTPGLWAFPVANGKSSGRPLLLHRDFAESVVLGMFTGVSGSLGVTDRGSLYYTLTNTNHEVWAIESFLPAAK